MSIAQAIFVRLALSNIRSFSRDAKKAQSDVHGIAKATKAANAEAASSKGFNIFGRHLNLATRAAGHTRGQLLHLAKSVIEVAGAFATVDFLKDAVKSTVELGEASLKMHKNLGLSIKDSSSWIEIAKVHGVETKQLSTAFSRLSVNLRAATQGSVAANSLFGQLGITQDDLYKGSTDFNFILGKVADGLKNMAPGTQRAALQQTLLGRSSQGLTLIMAGGAKGIEEMMAVTQKYGAYLKDGTNIEKFIEDQHKSEYAVEGLKLSLGQGLIPALTVLLTNFNEMIIAFREGTGTAGQIKEAFYFFTGVISGMYDLISSNKHTLEVFHWILIGIVGTLIAHQAALILVHTAMRLYTTAMWLATAAQWAFNFASDANPYILLAGIILTIAIGLYMLYKHSKRFHEAVDKVWNFIRKYWPLLVFTLIGPFGFLIQWMYNHWGQITEFVVNAKKDITSAATGMWDGISSEFTRIYDYIVHKWHQLVSIVDPRNLPGAGLLGDALGAAGGVLGRAGDIAGGLVGMAGGGTVAKPGFAMVGENGPEVRYFPQGASVIPLTSTLREIVNNNSVGSNGPRVIQIMLNQKVLGQAVIEETADRQARR